MTNVCWPSMLRSQGGCAVASRVFDRTSTLQVGHYLPYGRILLFLTR